MTLHFDVFFYKQQNNVRKVVYITTVRQNDQGLSETSLDLAELRLGESRKGNAHICKLDNADSYPGNLAAEVLYKIFKSKVAKIMPYMH